MATSPNSGCIVTVLRAFTQIRQSRTSHVRQTLSEIPNSAHLGGTKIWMQ